MIKADNSTKNCFKACTSEQIQNRLCTCLTNKPELGNLAKPLLATGLITGKAKELFLKWFRDEKIMSGFEDHSELVQVFALNEWFGTVGYKISIISRYIQDDFGYIVSINEGEFYKYGIKTRMEAEKLAIESANEDFNDRFSETCC